MWRSGSVSEPRLKGHGTELSWPWVGLSSWESYSGTDNSEVWGHRSSTVLQINSHRKAILFSRDACVYVCVSCKHPLSQITVK